MEFWGVEVKSGEPLTVSPGENFILHLSQACLGEVKKNKGNESVCLYVNIDGKKLVLGTLFSEKLPQQQFDLVFQKDFELSHNWKSGSVFFYGYKANNPYDETEDEEEDHDSDEDLPVVANNGKPEVQAKQEKDLAAEKTNSAKASDAGKQKVKIVEPNKDVKPEDDEDSDELDDQMYEDESETDDEDEESSESGDDEEDDEDEETPKKVEPSKKRPAESATKTPGADKKAKTVTPQKTDGKKGGGHVATPHPSKQAGKTPANKANQQTPKSAGSHPCKSCTKSFGSEQALDSHTKAKHK